MQCNISRWRSNRIGQGDGGDVGVEDADLFPEVQAARGHRDAIVVAARNKELGALVGKRPQYLEVGLGAQLLPGRRLDAEVRDRVALHVRLVVLRLADRGDVRPKSWSGPRRRLRR